jgi:UDP-N-acetylglucosamine 2-epimerase
LRGAKPDLIVVVGDVNSTMACAIVAAKLLVRVLAAFERIVSGNWRFAGPPELWGRSCRRTHRPGHCLSTLKSPASPTRMPPEIDRSTGSRLLSPVASKAISEFGG